MDVETFLNTLDRALDSQSGDCMRAERLALIVWWLVDRLATELAIDPIHSSEQVGMMATLAAEDMGDGYARPH